MKNRFVIGAAVLLSLAILSNTARADLVLHWTFDETTGKTAYDGSGHGLVHNGTLNGTGDWSSSPAKAGGAFATNTTSPASYGYVATPHQSDLAFGANDFSVSFWVYKLKGGDDPSQYHNIWGVTKWVDGSSANSEWLVTLSSDNKPAFSISTAIGPADNRSVKSTDELALEQWYHLVAVREGTGMYLYVDGELAASNATSLSSGASVMNAGTELRVGLNATPPWIFPVWALFDDVQIYNQALTAGEVTWLYNHAGLAVPEPGSLLLALASGASLLLTRGRRKRR